MDARKQLVKTVTAVIALCCSALLMGRAEAQTAPNLVKNASYLPANQESYLKLAEQIELMLRKDVLDVWFPRSIDNQNGGLIGARTHSVTLELSDTAAF